MGLAKSRIIGVLCPGPSKDRDSRSSVDAQSLDGYGDSEEDDDVELGASCCRISGGMRTGYSPTAADDGGVAETQMVVLRNRHSASETEGRATRLVTTAPRVHVVDGDCSDSQVLFSREIQILRHQCGHHRVR